MCHVSSNQNCLNKKLEKVQNRFLRMLAHKCHKDDLSLAMIASEFNIESLEFRRQYSDLRWLYKLLNSKTHCPEILSSIPLMYLISHYAPIPHFRFQRKKNYCLFAPVDRILMLGNKLETFDFFLTHYLN